MNHSHMELLVTDDWRNLLRDFILPFAFKGTSVAALGSDVLELGPGPGLTTDLLAPELTNLTSVEFDSKIATELAFRYAGSEVVTIIEGDARSMAFDNNTFSGAVCFTMLHHVPEVAGQDALFAETHRVLRPGGLFVANDSVTSPEFEEFHIDDICNPVDPEGLEERLLTAGFHDINVRWNDFGWAAQARA